MQFCPWVSTQLGWILGSSFTCSPSCCCFSVLPGMVMRAGCRVNSALCCGEVCVEAWSLRSNWAQHCKRLHNMVRMHNHHYLKGINLETQVNKGMVATWLYHYVSTPVTLLGCPHLIILVVLWLFRAWIVGLYTFQPRSTSVLTIELHKDLVSFWLDVFSELNQKQHAWHEWRPQWLTSLTGLWVHSQSLKEVSQLCHKECEGCGWPIRWCGSGKWHLLEQALSCELYKCVSSI